MGLLSVNICMFSEPAQTLPVAATLPEAVLLSGVGFSEDSLAAEHVFGNHEENSATSVNEDVIFVN